MNLAFNPKDSNSFASACLDRTVKVWTPGAAVANFTLDAHDKGVNYVDYYHGGDKPYLITSGDDRTIKIWDYISKSCIQTLEGHTASVSFVCFHPVLPLIISGSEDGTVKLWHSNTYRLESTLDYGLERAWCVAYRKAGNDIALGFDEGAVVIKLGKEEPSVSMDGSGKVVWAKGAEVLSANLGAAELEMQVDGQRIPAASREMGSTEVYAQSLQHSPNGRFVTVCGDGEYIIYTALAWRNKAFGAGLSFAWASDSNTYAVRESNSVVKVFRNFKERSGLVNVGFTVEDVKGGALLGVIGSGFVCFYHWETGALVRRIDVEAKNIFWSSTGELVAIVGTESFYILRYDRDAYQAYLDSELPVEDEGVEDAFDVVTEINEVVRTAKWTGECFIYTNAQHRIQYLVGEQTYTINHTDNELYLLGYLPSLGRVYLVDQAVSIYSFALSLSVVEYQTAILRKDFDGAEEILKTVHTDQRNRIARFLETQDLKQMALQVSADPDHKFELAIALDELDIALEIAHTGPDAGSEMRWRTIGDKALQRWNLQLALECFEKSSDLSTLLLIATSINDRSLIERIAGMAMEKNLVNIAFNCYLQLGDTKGCIDVLAKSGRIPEATLFARSYAPQYASALVKEWKQSWKESKRSKQDAIASSIADPETNPDAFLEGWDQALQKEKETSRQGMTTKSEMSQPPKIVPNEAVEATSVKANGVATPTSAGSTAPVTTNGV
jgi:coatomer subunit beta'